MSFFVVAPALALSRVEGACQLVRPDRRRDCGASTSCHRCRGKRRQTWRPHGPPRRSKSWPETGSGGLLLFFGRLIVGGLFGAVHAFLEVANALSEPLCDLGNSSAAEKDKHDSQDQQKLCGTKPAHGVPPASDSRLLADRRQQNKRTEAPRRRRRGSPIVRLTAQLKG